MHIGIIGYGKMGRDIFALFFDKLKNTEFTVLDVVGAEENKAAVMKNLGKSLKRKKLTEEEYSLKSESFRFTDNISELSDCDVVIEAVFEDMKVKKDIYSKLADIVSDKCLLLTNTSSLDISEIFSGIPNRERCFGLHFFYPVKLTGYVELNILEETSAECIETAKQLIISAGKRPVVFSGEYHIYLNQILACAVSQAIYLHKKYGVSVAELDKALSELFPVVSIFEVLDSVGLGLMSGNPDGFRIARNKELLVYGCGEMKKWIAEGCPEGTLSFLDFMAEKETETGKSCDGAELDMTALILNETVNALDEYSGDKSLLAEAAADTVGTAEKLCFYYEKYGYDAVISALGKLKNETGFNIYNYKEKEIWDKYLAKENN